MSSLTRRFGFTTLNQRTDSLDLHDFKFSDSDRVLLDRLLRYAAEGHTHTGRAADTVTLERPLTTLRSTGGALPPNKAVHYRYTKVDPSGQESISSAIAVVNTDYQVSSPSAPTLESVGTGSCPGGDYVYRVSAYTNEPTSETLASVPAGGSLSAPGGWIVRMPPLPSGATGWNVYRKGPTDSQFCFLATVSDPDYGLLTDNDVNVASNPWRQPPTVNTTSNSCSVIVQMPTGLDGGTWRLYRTYDSARWNSSLLGWTVADSYTDTGHATRAGSPPLMSASVGTAAKIDITDANVVTGEPPPSLVVSSRTVSFNFEGPVEPGLGPWPWISEFDRAQITAMRATLGRDHAPAAQIVKVGLQIRRHGTDEWIPVESYPGEYAYAWIPVGQTIGALRQIGYVTTSPTLTRGDGLRAVIIQSGGGATPTDSDLTIAVKVAVQHGYAAESYQWELD